jgi:hypothetical protein
MQERSIIFPQKLHATAPAITHGLTTTLCIDFNGMQCRLDPCGSCFDANGMTKLLLCSSTRITDINLPSRGFRGMFPTSLCDLTGLTTIRLQDNHFNSTLPQSLARLTDLNTLYLEHNDFTGTLPSSLTQLTGLVNLRLNDNSINGTVPESLITQITGLKRLLLGQNRLTGTLPASMADLPLNSLALGYNNFTGKIPTFNFSNLWRCCSLQGNDFSCPLPDDYQNCKGGEDCQGHVSPPACHNHTRTVR